MTYNLSEELVHQREHLFLWVPVFIGIGAGAYFALPFEPPLLFAAAPLAVLAPVILARGRPVIFPFLLLLFFAALGFTAGQARTHFAYTPILQKKINVTEVTGIIESVEDIDTGRRILLKDVTIEKLPPERTPVKIRLTMKKAQDFRPGDRVHILAGLNPPAEPVMPGAFDFQRYMYFQQIGAVGFVYKNLSPPVREASKFNNFIENLRLAIASRVNGALPPAVAPLSTALVTGHRAAIADDDNTAMQNSGLAHLISISGLHIGIFSALVFFVSRFLMACSQKLALNHPIKKYAAILAFFAALFYSLIAGGSIPTQRSVIMIGLAYFAILLDRSPFSLRLVAFAAAAVLLAAPENLVSASFQMSFAAVAALIVVFDALRPWWVERNREGGVFTKFFLYVTGVCLSTIIVTIATSPFTLFHFQQLALYGIIANALAVPVTTFIIMPAMVIALLAMPFGLDFWPLQVMGMGVQAVQDIAHITASLPHATPHLAALPALSLPFAASGLLFLGLWQGRLRVLGALPLFAALVIAGSHHRPDIFVSPDFRLAGFVAGDGNLYLSTRRNNKFTAENWERLLGLSQGSAKSWPSEGGAGGINCDSSACRLELHGHKISFLRTREAVAEECNWAEAVIAFDVVKKDLPRGVCSGVIILDKFDGLREGAVALKLNPSGITVETANNLRGNRPWSARNVIPGK